jgi:hypothetical protein
MDLQTKLFKLAVLFAKASFDTLQALVKAKEAAPEITDDLDKIALLFDDIDTASISSNPEQRMDDLANFVDTYDDLKDAIANIASRFQSNKDVIYFLNGVLSDAYDIVQEEVEEMEANVPFSAIQQEQNEGVANQLAGRTEKKLEYLREYSKQNKYKKRKDHLLKTDPDQYEKQLEQSRNRVQKHRENEDNYNKTLEKNRQYYKNMTPEQKEKKRLYKQKRKEELKRLQQG